MDKMNRKSKLKLSRETMTRLSGSGKKGGVEGPCVPCLRIVAPLATVDATPASQIPQRPE